MTYKLSNTSRERLAGVHPVLIEIIEEGIESSPYDFGIPRFGGLRSESDQKKLYDKGRTKASLDKGERVVTYTDGVRKKSNHQAKSDELGYAFDIYIYDHEKKRASWNVEKLSEVAIHLIKIAQKKNVLLIWGGNWTSFKDYPHFELRENV
jgi:peptidoglycan L-alanyl-D-glutamate endopeptidase CwlK